MKPFIQTQCPAFLRFLCLGMLTLLYSCNQQAQSPQGYDLTQPVKVELGKVLNEISGLTFNKETHSLLAISDSKEKVFEISMKKGKLKDYTNKIVPSDSDLEDLVKTDSALFLLSSVGVVYEVIGDSVKKYQLHIDGNNDFETMYYDPSADGLILVCKTCEMEKGRGIRGAFRFDLKTRTFDPNPFYIINRKEIEDVLKGENADFKPSAAAINPINKRVYMLSSAGQLLVILDNRGKVFEVYRLNPDAFPQAEGIAFAPNGDMFISNEGKFGSATLQLFRYQGNNKTADQKSK
jgi:hypothetical protein